MTHTWVRNKETGGTWHAPTDWLEQFPDEAADWEPCDPPVEINPAVAEHLAWRREQEAAAAENTKPTKPTKAASRGTKEEE